MPSPWEPPMIDLTVLPRDVNHYPNLISLPESIEGGLESCLGGGGNLRSLAPDFGRLRVLHPYWLRRRRAPIRRRSAAAPKTLERIGNEPRGSRPRGLRRLGLRSELDLSYRGLDYPRNTKSNQWPVRWDPQSLNLG